MRMPFLGRDKKDGKDAAKKPVAKQPAAKKKAAAKPPPPPKAPAAVGKTSAVGVSETWIQVFEKNEQAEDGERLTDEQISQFMKNEFPDQDAKFFDRVQIARGKYNRGGFHKKDKSGNVVRSKIHSQAHTGEGTAATRKFHPKGGAEPRRTSVDKYQKDFKSTKK